MAPMHVSAGVLALVGTATLNLAIGVYVYRRNPNAPLNRAFAFTAAAVAAWIGALAFGRYEPSMYHVAIRFAFAAGSLAPIGVIVFVEHFPTPSPIKVTVVSRVLLATAVALSLISFSPWMARDVVAESHGMQTIYGPLHPLLGAYLVVSFTYAGRVLWVKYRNSTGLLRIQIRQLFCAFVIPGALITVVSVIVPSWLKTSAYSRFAPLLSLAMIAIVGHAIIRHRLMDIRVVIKRGAVYLAAVLVSAAAFALMLAATNSLLPEEHDFSIREILLALLVGVCFQPVKKQVQRVVDRYLYRDPYDYQRTVREASRALTGTIDLPSLLGTVAAVVQQTLRPEWVALYVLEEEAAEHRLAWSAGAQQFPDSLALTSPLLVRPAEDWQLIFRDEVVSAQPVEWRERMLVELDRLAAEVIVPLVEENEVIGLLTIGPKRSGDPYFSNDADLLTTLANQSAVAVRNAQTHARVVQVNEEIQKILSTIDSGVVAVGPKGRITLFNRAAEQLTGVAAQIVRGQATHHLPAALARALEATAADGQPRSQIEFALPDAAGQLVPLMCSTSPLLGPQRHPGGAVAVISDMSRLKELEQEKRRAERLASIEAIASGLVHEIRNPLVSLKTYTQLLPTRGADPEFRETFSRTATREIGRMDDLLSRFRTLSTASRQPMELVDISGPLRSTLETLQPQLETRQIVLREVVHGTPRSILGNALQLQQLFLNLCLNAIEAMKPGGELTVRVADLSDAGGTTLLVEVADTGSGIPEPLLPTIFNPFVTTKEHGTGLGLAICRSIADAHHATLSARNNVGRPGSTFTIEFPVPAPRPARVAP